jgi:hypothetical protein
MRACETSCGAVHCNPVMATAPLTPYKPSTNTVQNALALDFKARRLVDLFFFFFHFNAFNKLTFSSVCILRYLVLRSRH